MFYCSYLRSLQYLDNISEQAKPCRIISVHLYLLEWCIVIQGNIHVPAIFSINSKYMHVWNIFFYSLFSRPRLSFFVYLQKWNNTLFFFKTIFQVCQNVIQSQYVLGVQRIQRYGNSLEFKLLGNPWNCGIDGHDGLHGRSLICHLINALASRSWRPVTSADVSAKYVHQDKGADYPIDVDSIFFAHDPTPVQPSAPPPMPYFQSYSQPYGPPPSYGSVQYDNPPPYDPPAYGGFAMQ